MAVYIVLPTAIMNANPSKDVYLSSVERSPFTNDGTASMRTMFLRHNFVVLAVVHVCIH